MLRFLAGAAPVAVVVALAAAPIHAQPGNNDKQNKGKPAAAAKAGGQGNPNRGGPDKAKGPGKQAQASQAKPDRGAPDAKAARPDKGQGKPAMAQGNQGNRGNGKQGGPDFAQGKDNGKSKGYDKSNGKDKGKGADIRLGYRDGDYAGGFLRDALGINRGLIDGCPPGLAKKRNGCLPPGQAKKLYSSYRPDFFGLRGLGDGRYYYNDGYLLRYGSGGLSGYIPLFGGALSIGNTWPNYYQRRELPRYYDSYYGLGGPGSYRYADNVVYRVDPKTAAITSIAAMLTGDDFVVGQPMPRGYDVYNVPYSYRDRYYDTPQARYRYSDGYIYRVDPQTMLITAAIDMLI